MKKEIEIKQRPSAFTELEGICIMSNIDSHDFMEVTEWTNGEGWDVVLVLANQYQMFHLSYGHLKALKKLIKVLNKS